MPDTQTNQHPVVTREIIDMAGRTVVVPTRINCFLGAAPYTKVLGYMVAPELLIDGPVPGPAAEQRYIRPESGKIRVPKGSRKGLGIAAETRQRRGPDLAAIMSLEPAFALLKGNARTDRSKASKYEEVGLPVIYVDLDEIDNYPAAIEFLGQLVGYEERANAMAARGRQILAAVDAAVGSLPESRKARVYYAESDDGLVTEYDLSLHADAIVRAGAKLVHEGLQTTHMGLEQLTFDQVRAYNPDFILTQSATFAAMAYADPGWQQIRAVAEGKILVAPQTPYAWFDRPPAATRLIGISWLAARLYPDLYPIDLKQELRELHKLFLGIDVADADLDEWLR